MEHEARPEAVQEVTTRARRATGSSGADTRSSGEGNVLAALLGAAGVLFLWVATMDAPVSLGSRTAASVAAIAPNAIAAGAAQLWTMLLAPRYARGVAIVSALTAIGWFVTG